MNNAFDRNVPLAPSGCRKDGKQMLRGDSGTVPSLMRDGLRLRGYQAVGSHEVPLNVILSAWLNGSNDIMNEPFRLQLLVR
jgi:hypothetical protein